MSAPTEVCARCGKAVVPRAQLAAAGEGVAPAGARGLCRSCENSARRDGTITQYRRAQRRAAEVAPAFVGLVERGEVSSRQEAADRLGVSVDGLDKLLQRAGVDGAVLPRGGRPRPVAVVEPEPVPVGELRLARRALAAEPAPGWWDRADLPCKGRTEEWFPDDRSGQTEASRQCRRRCPVMLSCLASALRTEEVFGVWGGLSALARGRVQRVLADDRSGGAACGHAPSRRRVRADGSWSCMSCVRVESKRRHRVAG